MVPAASSWRQRRNVRGLKAGRDGVWKSRIFPGLWLDGPALLARDSAKLMATAQQGLARTERTGEVRPARSFLPELFVRRVGMICEEPEKAPILPGGARKRGR